jgi:hypothetical protein
MKPLAFTEEGSVSQSKIEVLVVGSGFGGSVAAARIAKAGAQWSCNSPIFGRIFETMAEMSTLSGRKVHVSGRPATVHPIGGACVGTPEKGGVVDAGGHTATPDCSLPMRRPFHSRPEARRPSP